MRRLCLLLAVASVVGCHRNARDALRTVRLDDEASVADACERFLSEPFFADEAFVARLLEGVAIETDVSAEPLVEHESSLTPIIVSVRIHELSSRGMVHERRVLIRKNHVVFVPARRLDLGELATMQARLALFEHPEAANIESLLDALSNQEPPILERHPLSCSGTYGPGRRGPSGDCEEQLLLVPRGLSPGPDLFVIEETERFIGGVSCAMTVHYGHPLPPGPSLAAQVRSAFERPQRLEPAAALQIVEGW